MLPKANFLRKTKPAEQEKRFRAGQKKKNRFWTAKSSI